MGHQLEVELMKLEPSDFDSIQEIFTKIKLVIVHLNMCNINRNGTQMVLSILSKLGPDYSIFVFSFHCTILALGASFTLPTLDVFFSSLIQEKDKISQMGLQNSLKEHALTRSEENMGASKKNAHTREKWIKEQGFFMKTSTPMTKLPNKSIHGVLYTIKGHIKKSIICIKHFF